MVFLGLKLQENRKKTGRKPEENQKKTKRKPKENQKKTEENRRKPEEKKTTANRGPSRKGYRLDPRSRWSWCCACFLVTPMAIRGNKITKRRSEDRKSPFFPKKVKFYY